MKKHWGKNTGVIYLAGLLVPFVVFGEIKKEFIFDSAPFTSCHASTLVETKNGEILAAWFGGNAEGSPDVGIWMSRRTQKAWSAPYRVVKEPDAAMYNPVLFRAADSVLWLYYKFGPSPASWTGAYLTSQDRKSTRLNSSHSRASRMPSSA